MNKKILIGIVALLVITSVWAITNRDKILILLNDYEEECYVNETFVWYNYDVVCNHWGNCNLSFPMQCACLGEEVIPRLNAKTTEKCIKWHLVRVT